MPERRVKLICCTPEMILPESLVIKSMTMTGLRTERYWAPLKTLEQEM